MNDNRNLIIMALGSIAIFGAWNFFYEAPRLKEQQAIIAAQKQSMPQHASQIAPATTLGVVAPTADKKLLSRTAAISQDKRIQVRNERLHGSLNLTDGRIDDVTLGGYHEKVDPKSPQIVLFSPANTEKSYYATFSWASPQPEVSLPTQQTLWHANNTDLTPSKPVVLTWSNGQGLKFEKRISLDENYMFTVTQKVINTTNKPIDISAAGAVVRPHTPETGGFFILHEGPIGFLGGKLREFDYKDFEKKPLEQFDTTGGWIGITDKFWLAALVPDQNSPQKASFQGSANLVETTLSGAFNTVAPGASLEQTTHLFAGAKELHLLDHYEEALGVKHFDLAVDFGWFYFLTKPTFYLLDWIKSKVGNFGIAILLLTVLFKLALFPLANKSYRSMAKMKALQPHMERVRERFASDKIRQNQELMALYKKHHVNPLAGCLPVLVQAPIFFALYKVLFVSIEMRHAPFFGWIQDLSAPDPTTIFNFFGLIPWDPPSWLMFGAWPLIMGATMVLQQKMSPPPGDPAQAKMMMMMPIMFTFMLAQFPAGLLIYWSWSNILSILQQWSIMRLEAKNSAAT